MTPLLLKGVVCALLVGAGPSPWPVPYEQTKADPALRLRLVQRLQDQTPGALDVNCLAQSPDGKRLAWGEATGAIGLHAFDSGLTIRVPNLQRDDIGQERGIVDLAFDDRGRLWWLEESGRVCVSDDPSDGTSPIRKAAAPKPVVPSNLLPWGVLSIDFGRWLWSKEGASILELQTGRVHKSEVLFPDQRGINAFVSGAVRSPDGQWLAVVADGNAALLSLPDMRIVRRLGPIAAESAAFSPTCGRIALGTYLRGVHVWQTQTDQFVQEVEMPGYAVVRSLVFVGEDILYTNDSPVCRVDLRTKSVAAVGPPGATVLLLSDGKDRLFVGTGEGGVDVYELPAVDRPPAASQPASQTMPTQP